MEYSNKCRLKILPNSKMIIKLPFNITSSDKAIVLNFFNKINKYISKPMQEPFKIDVHPERIAHVCSRDTALGIMIRSKSKHLVILY